MFSEIYPHSLCENSVFLVSLRLVLYVCYNHRVKLFQVFVFAELFRAWDGDWNLIQHNALVWHDHAHQKPTVTVRGGFIIQIYAEIRAAGNTARSCSRGVSGRHSGCVTKSHSNDRKVVQGVFLWKWKVLHGVTGVFRYVARAWESRVQLSHGHVRTAGATTARRRWNMDPATATTVLASEQVLKISIDQHAWLISRRLVWQESTYDYSAG